MTSLGSSGSQTDCCDERAERRGSVDGLIGARGARALGGQPILLIAASDYVGALPDQLARFIQASFVSLGSDGYGVSDTQDELRAGTRIVGNSTTRRPMTTPPHRAGSSQGLVV